MGFGLQRVPCFLLLLLLIASGTAQARNVVFLDIEKQTSDSTPTYKEQISLSKIHVPDDNQLCSTCENFTNKTLSYLNDKQLQNKVKQILHDACAQTFPLEQKCVELVDSYATLLFAKIAEIKPNELCKQYGLCGDIALLSGVKSDSTCAFCHHIIDEVVAKLKDPASQFEILQILLKECNKIEGHVQQCKRLVLQYIPLILVSGEKFLEKNDLCAVVQLCPASQKRTVGEKFQGEPLSDA